MLFLWHKYKVSIIFVVLVIVSVIMLTFPKVPYLNNSKALFIYLISPSQNISSRISSTTSNFWNNMAELVKAREENTILQDAIKVLKDENNHLRQRALENQRLRKLLGFKEILPYSTIAGRVIAQSPFEVFTTVLIDKGSRDGVIINMPVVAYQESNKVVAGKISEVMEETSQVILLTNPLCRINAVISRSGTGGLVEGEGNINRCQLNYLTLDADIAVGDSVVTSGKGSMFPEGLLIGEITKVGLSKGKLYKSAEIIPAVNVSRLEEVLVIKK
jgi:rod shape-determining protein MreC